MQRQAARQNKAATWPCSGGLGCASFHANNLLEEKWHHFERGGRSGHRHPLSHCGARREGSATAVGGGSGERCPSLSA